MTVPEAHADHLGAGQVLKPSVYQVPEGTTVAEAVALAGVEGADLSLAKLMRRDSATETLNLREARKRQPAANRLTDGDTLAARRRSSFGVLARCIKGYS